MTKKYSALLLVSTALLLTSCKDDGSNFSLMAWLRGESEQIAAKVKGEPEEDTGPYPYKTVSGSYLSGRFAQSNSDWSQAYEYISDILPAEPANIELRRRAMVLAMGSGHSDEAFALSQSLIKSGDTGSLPRVFMTLKTFKAGKYSESLQEMTEVPKDGISEFVTPLVRAWAKAGLGQTDIDGLGNNVVHIYHSILIADYLNNEAALKKLATRDLTQLNLAPQSLERIADIFARHQMMPQAQALYTYIRNSDPAAAKNITAKVTMMEKSGTVPQEPEDRIASPMEGLAQALFDMASVLYGEYQDSARLFAQMSLYLNPNLNDSRILLGHMAARVGRYDDAIAFYQQIDPRDDEELEIKLQRQIAELLEQSDRSDQAIGVLKKLVDKTNSLDAQIQLGDSYRHIEDYTKALTAYNKAYEMLGNNVPQEHWSLIYARGMTNERLHNWDQAEKDLKAALAFEPDHPYILNYLGYSWADQGINLDKAAEMIARAVRLRPTDGSIVDSLGWVYYRMGKYTEAVATLESAVELLPYDPTVNDHLGDAYWQVGRKTEARFQWTRALSFSKEEELSRNIQEKLDKGLVATAEGKPQNNAQKQAQNKSPDKSSVSP